MPKQLQRKGEAKGNREGVIGRATPHVCRDLADALIKLEENQTLSFKGRVVNPCPWPANPENMGELAGEINIFYTKPDTHSGEEHYIITEIREEKSGKRKPRQMFIIARYSNYISCHVSKDRLSEPYVTMMEDSKQEPLRFYPHIILFSPSG